ncbi:MAG TPA: TRAP transporter small permease subunit [Alcanivorax sp.]|nr:TRAP transporter small permease subunit [Alcanivorax sp.]
MTRQRLQHLKRWQQRLTAFTCGVGHLCAWFSLAMVVLMVLVVVLRYGFGIGSIALQESLTYLHGALFMLGAAYALALDEHVRVDVFYQHFSPRRRALVNVLGTLFLLLPVCVAIFGLSFEYVVHSWAGLERSDNGGLPLVFVLKSLLLALPALLALQAAAELIRHGLTLAGATPPQEDLEDEGGAWS